ncbi:NUDIX domain-containing protein [Emcibacter sp. SYSU 3D8]|uniref:NUDIX hydrolase n=1 Tax=Emcibacter sp. SYSU 3D8 TaxID=3133969 RepID=UPI0031FF0326
MTEAIPFAATVLLLRDRPDEMEVLMVQRHRDMKFMGGALVFPGGKHDAADVGAAKYATCASDDVALRITAIREVFEECGILLAREKDGSGFVGDAHREQIAERHRKRLDKGEMNMVQLAEAENIEFMTDLLVPFAHWVTPTGAPRRYDTWFYMVRVPEDHIHAHDGGESIDSVWISASQALADEAAKLREITFPTRMQLAKLGRNKTVDAALDAARRATIVTVLPEIRDGKLQIPLEADYDITEEELSRALHK